MNALDQIWTIAELAEHAGRDESSVRQWLMRQIQRMGAGRRAALARKTTGRTAIWLINRNHVLIQAYIAQRRTSHNDNTPEE